VVEFRDLMDSHLLAIAILIAATGIILLGAEAFTNALEHLGERLKISEGITGSIFAAVGTALPESMVPVIAILGSTGSEAVRHEVGIGAILGAPLLLSTLAFFLMAVFAAQQRGWSGEFRPEPTGLNRDLTWFLMAFTLGSAALFVPAELSGVRWAIAGTLVLMYCMYLFLTIRASKALVADGHGTEADHPLFLSKIRLPTNLLTIIAQLGLGLGLIVVGTKGFIHSIEHISAWLSISVLVLSLLIIPFATELPEKVNSILWIRRGRDTLAFGNISGALVFQGSLLPALGIALTAWTPRPEMLLGIGIALFASIYLFIQIHLGTLKPYHMVFNGVCYAAYVILLLTL